MTDSTHPVSEQWYLVWTATDAGRRARNQGDYWLSENAERIEGVTHFAPIPTREQAIEVSSKPRTSQAIVDVPDGHYIFSSKPHSGVFEYLGGVELRSLINTDEWQALEAAALTHQNDTDTTLWRAFEEMKQSLDQ